MGKSKHYYYGDIKKWIMMRDQLPEGRQQVEVFNKALEEALEETGRLPDGDLRLRAIDEILIKKTKTYEGVAQELHYGARTIQEWIATFIKTVGRRAGF